MKCPKCNKEGAQCASFNSKVLIHKCKNYLQVVSPFDQMTLEDLRAAGKLGIATIAITTRPTNCC